MIEYFHNLSSPPAGAVDLQEKARRGLSCFLTYLAEVAAPEPGSLSFLPGRSHKAALSIYGSRTMLIRHVIECLAQKVLLDEKHTPQTHRYTTPLAWPPVKEGEDPAHMPRFTLYINAIRFLFGGIEGVGGYLVLTSGPVQVELEKAIRKHYARGGQRGKRTS